MNEHLKRVKSKAIPWRKRKAQVYSISRLRTNTRTIVLSVDSGLLTIATGDDVGG